VLLSALILVLAIHLTGVQGTALPSYVPNPNCATNSSGICTACSNGYYLSNGYCYTGNPFCVTSDPNTGLCLTCGVNYFTNGFCLVIGAKCAGGSNPPCSSCDSGYTILSNLCVESTSLSPFCATFNGSSCSSCISGYFVYSGGCTQANPTCLTYNMTNGACLTCYPGYSVQNGYCVSSVGLNPFCLTFSGQSCSVCQSGYFLFNGICTLGNSYCSTYDLIGNCLTCSSGNPVGNLCLVSTSCSSLDANGNCLSCSAGFTPWGTECVTLASLYPFCSNFGTNSTCTACIAGTYLANGVCLVGNPFCLTSNSNGQCLTCYAGDIFSSPLCLVLAANCASTTSSGTCATCGSGYTLLSGLCVSLASLDPACSSFTGTTCNGCLSGYYLNSGICVQANPACLSYNMNTGACTACYNGLSVWGNTCGNIAGINPFCATLNGTVCSVCTTGYTLYNGICYLANPFCSSYGPGGICLTCSLGNLQGFLCLVDTSCDSYDGNGNCLTCPFGFTLWNLQCVSYSSLYPFCLNFNSSNICTACVPGSFFNNGVCVIGNPFCASYNSDGSCFACTSGNYQSGPLCLVISPSCTTTSSSGLCTSCPSGYAVLSGVCVEIISMNPYCSAISGSTCTSCLVGYYLNNGQCYIANTLCYSYNMNTGACTACYNGYIVYNGACVVINLALVNPNCLTFDGLVCTACNTGFYFFNGICIAVDSFCATYDPNTGFCLTCTLGTLHGNYCYVSIACASADGSGNCITCPSNYVVW
jgi:proprotein convertase subtilisin/kexin type 5